MSLRWRNILGMLICSAFFIAACSSEKDEQMKLDLDFISNQQKHYERIEISRSHEADRKLQDFYRRGFIAQSLIRKYNVLNDTISNALKQYGALAFWSTNLDSLHHRRLRWMKLKVMEDQDEGKSLSRKEFESLNKFLDSCLISGQRLSPPVELWDKKMQLLSFQNNLVDAISFSCEVTRGCGWWDPYYNSVMIRNFEENKISFLEVNYPSEHIRHSFGNLQKKGAKDGDSISMTALNTRFGNYSDGSVDSSLFILELKGLQRGFYSIEARASLIAPNMSSFSRPMDKSTYRKIIEFEVFK